MTPPWAATQKLNGQPKNAKSRSRANQVMTKPTTNQASSKAPVRGGACGANGGRAASTGAGSAQQRQDRAGTSQRIKPARPGVPKRANPERRRAAASTT